jgi:hypothetical protein
LRDSGVDLVVAGEASVDILSVAVLWCGESEERHAYSKDVPGCGFELQEMDIEE